MVGRLGVEFELLLSDGDDEWSVEFFELNTEISVKKTVLSGLYILFEGS